MKRKANLSVGTLMSKNTRSHPGELQELDWFAFLVGTSVLIGTYRAGSRLFVQLIQILRIDRLRRSIPISRPYQSISDLQGRQSLLLSDGIVQTTLCAPPI